MLIDPTAYRRMYELEDEHWWFEGMEIISARLLDQLTGLTESALPRTPEILDAGCGTGRNLRFLSRYGQVTGLDYSADALECCASRGFKRLIRGSVNVLPFADASFDLVTSFDVLVTAGVDDKAAIEEFNRVLRPGGWLLLRMAAYDWLRSRHDREWAVVRRYHRPKLRKLLAATGLEVRRASYANMWLLPAALLKRVSEHWTAPTQESSDLQIGAGRTLSGRILRVFLGSEARAVSSRWGLPCGLSLFALARKPGSVERERQKL